MFGKAISTTAYLFYVKHVGIIKNQLSQIISLKTTIHYLLVISDYLLITKYQVLNSK